MKKTLIMLAAAALVLVGCDETNPEGTTIDSISIVPSSVEIPVSDSIGQALTLSWTPSTAPAPAEVIWATSDESVVSVENGWIVPVGEGLATITAKVGELEASCQVTVTGKFDLFKYSDCVLVGIGDAVEGAALREIEDRDGIVHTCALFRGTWYAFGDGIYLEGNSFAGADYLAQLEAPVYIIVDSPEEDAIGAYFSGDIFITPDTVGVTNYADSAYCAVAGEMVDFAAYANLIDKYYWQGDTTFTDEEAVAYLSAITGSTLQIVDFNQGGVAYLTEGLIQSALLSDAENYIMNIRWMTGFYGLKLTQTETEEWDILRPYEFSYVDKHYEVLTSSEGSEVSARRIQNVKYTEIPAIKRLEPASLKELRFNK